MQGHYHDAYNNSAGLRTAYTPIGGGSAFGGGLLTAPSAIGSPSSDGTNGNPRTGTTTRGKRLGVNYIIKY